MEESKGGVFSWLMIAAFFVCVCMGLPFVCVRICNNISHIY